MSFNWLKNLVLASGVLLSSASFAGVITDVEQVDTYLSYGQSVSWTHNLNDEGFVLGSAVGGYIQIDLKDDAKGGFLGLDGLWMDEFARIIIEIADFQDDAGSVYAGTDYIGGLGVNSLVRLNSDGMLDVQIWSVAGDFIVGNSALTVFTKDIVASVPEPTTLALFGLGLIGLGLARRNAKA